MVVEQVDRIYTQEDGDDGIIIIEQNFFGIGWPVHTYRQDPNGEGTLSVVNRKKGLVLYK